MKRCGKNENAFGCNNWNISSQQKVLIKYLTPTFQFKVLHERASFFYLFNPLGISECLSSIVTDELQFHMTLVWRNDWISPELAALWEQHRSWWPCRVVKAKCLEHNHRIQLLKTLRQRSRCFEKGSCDDDPLSNEQLNEKILSH